MKNKWTGKGKSIRGPLLMLCLFFIVPLSFLLLFRLKGVLITSVFWFLFCVIFFLLPLYYYALNVLDRLKEGWQKHRVSIGVYSMLGAFYFFCLYAIYTRV